MKNSPLTDKSKAIDLEIIKVCNYVKQIKTESQIFAAFLFATPFKIQ